MKKIAICPWCHSQTTIIWVHGHGQCSNCGINIDECCSGEQCDTTQSDAEPSDNSDE